MRKVTTILCSVAFMISGIMLAMAEPDSSPNTGYKTLSASTLNVNNVPKGLLRDFANKSVPDTVYITKTDTIKEQVTKVRVKKVPVPSDIVETNVITRTDTIQVPVYYLATQVGNKEGPTGECIQIYEVHKIDEICPDTTNSYVEGTNEYHVIEGAEL